MENGWEGGQYFNHAFPSHQQPFHPGLHDRHREPLHPSCPINRDWVRKKIAVTPNPYLKVTPNPYPPQPIGVRKALDLFSGTGSVSNRLRQLGYEVVSVDINPRCKPSILTDILKWKFQNQFPPGYFEVVVASPPCEEYSQAKTTKPRQFFHADQCVQKTLQIVRYFQPRVWWLENPRFGHLRNRPFMHGVPYCDVDYCQFSDWGYKKPTRIWGKSENSKLPPRLCDPNVCPNCVNNSEGRKVHKEPLGGIHMRMSPEQKGRLPLRLVDYLLQQGEFGPEKNVPLTPGVVSGGGGGGLKPNGGPGIDRGPETTGDLGIDCPGIIRVKPCWLRDQNYHRVGSINYRGGELQLVMLISALLPGGGEQK